MRWEYLAVALIAFAFLWSFLGRGAEPPTLPSLHDPAEEGGGEPVHLACVQPGARPEAELEDLKGARVVSMESLAARPAPPRMAYDVQPRPTLGHARIRRPAGAADAPALPTAGSRLRLGGPGELRRAVLMAEVLGKPRALRPLDEENR